MKRIPILLLLSSFFFQTARAGAPDSVYLFSFATDKKNNTIGLQFAWSENRYEWHLIGNDFGFLKSDYGRWGTEKKMIDPFLFQDKNALWHCVWTLNHRERVFAHASSSDLVEWGRQTYPSLSSGKTFMHPVVQPVGAKDGYKIIYKDSDNKFFSATTNDFGHYLFAEATQPTDPREQVTLNAVKVYGQVHRVPFHVVSNLIRHFDLVQYKARLYSENSSIYAQLFPNLKSVDATLELSAKSKPISDKLIGVFFEDINYAADGGLYAELIQNRDFEYSPADREYRDKNWNSTFAWSVKGDVALAIDSAGAIHENNRHYAVLSTKGRGALLNSGFGGIAVRKGEKYDVSCFIKKLEGNLASYTIRLRSENGDVLAQQTIRQGENRWKKVTSTLEPVADDARAAFEIEVEGNGSVAFDLISMFPRNTFKARKNGLRSDLAKAVADLHPKFVRFPGGCVAHGDGLGNIYHWKNTIGPVESRKQQRNLWGYHQSVGLGYFEYFQFCEDIGAEPVPVVAAGVPCQNSGTGGGGQQGGLPLDEMDEYIQDILDLIEYANGSAQTTWGKRRAEAGHPKPFNLKYIGIGNEDLITDVFEERFKMIYEVVKKKHPEITVIGTVGPSAEGTDYVEGWKIADNLAVPMVDEHYYQSPAWFIYNQDFYDKYDRSRSKVYLGEYAAHLPGRPNNIETAMAEAIYLTAVERNADVVTMASYAPLLAKEGATQWNPDLIYFNNASVTLTPGYFVQKLFSDHSGTEYISSSLNVQHDQDAVRKRIACSVVKDSKSGDVIIKVVNILPVPCNLRIQNPQGSLQAQARRIQLTGGAADKVAMPQAAEASISSGSPIEFPPFSLTILRFKGI